MGQLKRWEQWLVSANQALIGLMMLLMFVMVFTNVVTRYGFGFSIAWAEEVSSFLMIWVTYLAAELMIAGGLTNGRVIRSGLLGGATGRVQETNRRADRPRHLVGCDGAPGRASG